MGTVVEDHLRLVENDAPCNNQGNCYLCRNFAAKDDLTE